MLNKNVLTDIVDSLKCNYISEDLTVMESAVAEALKKYWSLTEKGDIEDVMDALADNGIEEVREGGFLAWGDITHRIS